MLTYLVGPAKTDTHNRMSRHIIDVLKQYEWWNISQVNSLPVGNEEHSQDFAELDIEAFPEFMLAEDHRHLP